MPDQYAATPVQPFDLNKGLGAISAAVGIQQQRQALQTGQYQQASAQATSEQDQQKNAELQAAQKAVLGGAKTGRYTKPDGSFDGARAAEDVMTVAPTYGGQAAHGLVSTANEVVQNTQAHQNLNRDQQAQLGATFGALASKVDANGQPTVTNTDVIDALDALSDQNPQIKRMALSMATHIPGNATPQQLQQILRQWSVSATSPESAAGQSTPATQTMQGPQGLQVINTNPQAPGGVGTRGAPLPQGVTPGLVTLPNSQPGVVGPNGALRVAPMGGNGAVAPPNGVGAPMGGAGPAGAGAAPNRPRTAADDAPPPNAPKAVQDNYTAAAATARQHVEDTRKADEGYGNNIAISNTIRHLAPTADTGPGKQLLNNALATLGVQAGKDNQELGAFLDRQAASLRTQMGLPGTDAGAADARSIAGHTGYNKDVIQDKNDYTQSLVEGTHQYRQGLDRIEGFSGQPSPKAVQQYRSAWAANFDPNVYKLDIVKAQGGPAAVTKFVNSLAPAEAASLAQKRKNLQLLSKGQIPP